MVLEKEDKYDLAIIGAGPAGIMAACQAAKKNLRVVLIEKNESPGKKFLLTGNGRCNLTNLEPNLRDLVANYNNGEFLFHAFSILGPQATIDFFNQLGIKTKTEANKRVFPYKIDARGVLDILLAYLKKNNVEIIFDSTVTDFVVQGKSSKTKKIKKVTLNTGEIQAKTYILCSGGKSYPTTGSDGSGYVLAEKLGHTIIKPKPALCPIGLKEKWIKDVQGISIEKVGLTILHEDKKVLTEKGDILFTHFGISGPVALNISGKVGDILEKSLPINKELKIAIDLFPFLNYKEVSDGFEELVKKYPRQSLKNVLSELAPERFIKVFLTVNGINGDKNANNMPKLEKESIAKILKTFEVTAENLYSFDSAMVTRGGISLKEVNHKTMQSKIIGNLYFAGEILDIDGKTGGFNLQNCWSTGYLAGKNASQK